MTNFENFILKNFEKIALAFFVFLGFWILIRSLLEAIQAK